MTFRKHLDKGTDQDGRVGRLLAHLLPWHTKLVTIYRATADKTRRLAEKIFYNERYKEGTTIRWVGGAEMSTQDLYPRWETHKQKDNYNLKRLSPGSEGV